MNEENYKEDLISGICGRISESDLLKKYPNKTIGDLRADAVILNINLRGV